MDLLHHSLASCLILVMRRPIALGSTSEIQKQTKKGETEPAILKLLVLRSIFTFRWHFPRQKKILAHLCGDQLPGWPLPRLCIAAKPILPRRWLD